MMMLSAFLAAVAAFNLYLASLPPISNFDDIKPNPVTSIYSLDGEVIKTPNGDILIDTIDETSITI